MYIFLQFQIENDLKVLISNEMCTENCTINMNWECDFEAKEEEQNRIMRKRNAEYEEIPHRNRNKKRKKLNVKFQVRGKYINDKSVMSGGMTLPSGFNASIQFNRKAFICPVGFVPRKNRCGEKTVLLNSKNNSLCFLSTFFHIFFF